MSGPHFLPSPTQAQAQGHGGERPGWLPPDPGGVHARVVGLIRRQPSDPESGCSPCPQPGRGKTRSGSSSFSPWQVHGRSLTWRRPDKQFNPGFPRTGNSGSVLSALTCPGPASSVLPNPGPPTAVVQAQGAVRTQLRTQLPWAVSLGTAWRQAPDGRARPLPEAARGAGLCRDPARQVDGGCPSQVCWEVL